MKMRLLAVAVGLGALAMATGASAAGYIGGKGLVGSPHDFSSAVSADGTSGGQSVLQWLDSKGQITTSAYNNAAGGSFALNAPNCVAAGTAGSVPNPNCTAAGLPNQSTTRIQVGICTKCHTAHKAKTQALLWNHTLNSVSYNWGNTSTTSGTVYPSFKGDTYTGPTPKCLSCHDGAIASTDGQWFNKGYLKSTLTAPVVNPNSSHLVADGSTGSMVGTHPVAMPYPYNGGINAYNGTTTTQITADSGWIGDPSANGVTLYNDAGGFVVRGASAGRTGIECGSCHDVHNGPRVPDTSASQSSPLLLVGFNTGSATGKGGYICYQCHVK